MAVGDGKYIFIMLADKQYDNKLLVSSKGKEYPFSGLYRNDGSIIPIWTVDWYAYRVYISLDGSHLVRMGGPPILQNYDKPDLKQLAIAFYLNGELTKEYLISDLIKYPERLHKSIFHFEWRLNVLFDDKLGQLTIDTYDGQQYVFDVKSGEVITKR